jgi:hypothetical protein
MYQVLTKGRGHLGSGVQLPAGIEVRHGRQDRVGPRRSSARETTSQTSNPLMGDRGGGLLPDRRRQRDDRLYPGAAAQMNKDGNLCNSEGLLPCPP